MGRGDGDGVIEAAAQPRSQDRGAAQIKARFYRSGSLEKRSLAERLSSVHEKRREFEIELEDSLRAADRLCPDQPGRVGRADALYCSDSLEDLARWTRANLDTPAHDPTPRELTYEGPEPFAYPVSLWNAASSGRDAAIRRYWDSGISLSEWSARREELPNKPEWRGGAEILIDPSFVKGSRRVSFKRLYEAAGSMRDELLKAWKRRLGAPRVS